MKRLLRIYFQMVGSLAVMAAIGVFIWYLVGCIPESIRHYVIVGVTLLFWTIWGAYSVYALEDEK